MLLIPLILASSYLTTSLFFFFFPTLLHPKKKFKSELLQTLQKPKNKKILHIAHRGGSRESLENSVEALTNALQAGANIIELDVQYTKDKTIVLSNDSTLIRLCGVEGQINQKNYKDLPPISKQISLEYSNESSFLRGDNSQSYFSTIEEVFLRFPNAFLMLDLKNASKELAVEINNLISVHEREDITIWGDFSGRINLKKINSNIPCVFSRIWMILIFLLFPLGLLPFLPLKHEIFSYPMLTSEARYSLKKSRFKYFLLRLFDCMSSPIFYHLQKRGVLIFLWVLNTDKEFLRANKRGVQGIITDRPTDLQRFLEKRELYCTMT